MQPPAGRYTTQWHRVAQHSPSGGLDAPAIVPSQRGLQRVFEHLARRPHSPLRYEQSGPRQQHQRDCDPAWPRLQCIGCQRECRHHDRRQHHVQQRQLAGQPARKKPEHVAEAKPIRAHECGGRHGGAGDGEAQQEPGRGGHVHGHSFRQLTAGAKPETYCAAGAAGSCILAATAESLLPRPWLPLPVPAAVRRPVARSLNDIPRPAFVRSRRDRIVVRRVRAPGSHGRPRGRQEDLRGGLRRLPRHDWPSGPEQSDRRGAGPATGRPVGPPVQQPRARGGLEHRRHPRRSGAWAFRGNAGARRGVERGRDPQRRGLRQDTGPGQRTVSAGRAQFLPAGAHQESVPGGRDRAEGAHHRCRGGREPLAHGPRDRKALRQALDGRARGRLRGRRRGCRGHDGRGRCQDRRALEQGEGLHPVGGVDLRGGHAIR